MMYGMATCGLSGDQIKEIQRAVMKHVWAIVNNQAHITGDSHATIRQKFDIPQASDDIAYHIHQVANQQQLRPDWMYTESWQQHLLARQQLLHEQLDEDERAESLQWACPHCEALFPTQAALKIHARRMHQHCDAPDIVFNKSLHSIGGLPTCRFCLKKFTRWQTLAQHISANRCPKYMPDLGTSKSTYDHQPVCKPTSAELPAEHTIAEATARITQRQFQMSHRLVKNRKCLHLRARASTLSSDTQRSLSNYGRHVGCVDNGLHRIEQLRGTISIVMLMYYEHLGIALTNTSNVQPRRVLPVTSAMFDARTGENTSASVLPLGNVQYSACCRRSLDHQMAEFFGAVKQEQQEGGASKRRRPQYGARDQREYRNSRDQEYPVDGRPKDASLLFALARQVIKQDQEIKILRQDHALIWFMRPGDHNILCHLYRTARQFTQQQQDNPKWGPGQQPLKVVMAIALFTELGHRLEKACKDEEFSKKIKELGWRDPAVGWSFQTWNPTLRCLEADSSRTPLSDQQVAQHLLKLTQLLATPDLLHRFSCTRKMMETMEGTASFMMDLSIRTPQAMEAWTCLLALQGCTVLQLGGLAYKREGFKPSPAILKIKAMIRQR